MMLPYKKTGFILFLIVLAQFACISVWFASNAVVPELINLYSLPSSALAHITSAVQFGFIIGTLIYAFLSIADRFSPSKVFFISAVFAAAFNLAPRFWPMPLELLLTWRFFTGFFLAGIYPVGMKIAADYHEKGLGKALGYLVGALVLGTAFPHLLRSLTASLSWTSVLLGTSMLCVMGGIIILVWVPDGPYRKKAASIDLSAIGQVFKIKPFRRAAFGYFGHMWELYAFWAFIPVIISIHISANPNHTDLNISLWAFLIIASGGLACVIGGYFSARYGSNRIAFYALLISSICCLLSPWFIVASTWVFIAAMLLWGMTVIADSPQFSSLVALETPPEIRGTALTIVNSIGIAITILSIQLLQSLSNYVPPRYLFLVLVIGPVAGLLAMSRSLSAK
jgi:MFS family permease